MSASGRIRGANRPGKPKPMLESRETTRPAQSISIPALAGSGIARILVAGMGNASYGDDAFGSEIIRESQQRPWPAGVRLVDFGIRSYDLAFALADGYDAVILVDAAPRGQVPGTLYLVEIEQEQIAQAKKDPARTDSAVEVIRMANAIGQSAERIYLVACEPAVLDSKGARRGLSATVEAAVTPAVDLIQTVVEDLLKGRPSASAG